MRAAVEGHVLEEGGAEPATFLLTDIPGAHVSVSVYVHERDYACVYAHV